MSLDGWYVTWEIIAAIGTVAVFVGVFLEYGLGIFSVLKFWGLHPAHIEVETRTERFGSMLVVLGLAVELIGGVGVVVTSFRIETQHQREIAEIRHRIDDRDLSPDQLKTLVTKMAQFNGAGLRMDIEADDWETNHIALQIADSCTKAGWTVGPGYRTIVGPRLTRGISLSSRADSWSAADALASELRNDRIEITGPGPPPNPLPPPGSFRNWKISNPSGAGLILPIYMRVGKK